MTHAVLPRRVTPLSSFREPPYSFFAVSRHTITIAQHVPQVRLRFYFAVLRCFRQPMNGSRIVLGNALPAPIQVRQIVFPLGQACFGRKSKPFCSGGFASPHTLAEKGHSSKRVSSARITLFSGLQEPARGRL